MKSTFEHFVQNGLLLPDAIESMNVVCIPIFSVRDDWWFDYAAGHRFNENDPSVSPFLGIVRRFGGAGLWMRELQFDGYERTVTTSDVDDLDREHERTPVGSWVWWPSAGKALCYCNPASDAHVLCLDPQYILKEQLQLKIRDSLLSSVSQISTLQQDQGRRWHSMFIRHHMRLGVQLESIDSSSIMKSLIG